jgi:UMF1 family MFS transporter
VRSWRRHGNIVRFLAALYLINDAVVTVAFFAAIYFRQQFGLGLEDLLRLILLYQLLAIPGTYIFGQIADRMSLHSAIYASLAIWVAAVLLMAFGTGPYVPALVVGLFAMVIGSTQALMRGLYAVLVPAGRSAEFFGFNAFASRLSAAAGPLAFGIVSAVSGSQRIALVSILVFLGAGALLLAGVKTRSPSAEANPEAA